MLIVPLKCDPAWGGVSQKCESREDEMRRQCGKATEAIQERKKPDREVEMAASAAASLPLTYILSGCLRTN